MTGNGRQQQPSSAQPPMALAEKCRWLPEPEMTAAVAQSAKARDGTFVSLDEFTRCRERRELAHALMKAARQRA
jgi:hypothetical protein